MIFNSMLRDGLLAGSGTVQPNEWTHGRARYKSEGKKFRRSTFSFPNKANMSLIGTTSLTRRGRNDKIKAT